MPDQKQFPRVSALQAVMGLAAGWLWRGRRDGWPLSTHLTLLAVAIMVPLLVLAGLGLNNHLEAARGALYQDAQRMADSLAANIEREMTSVLTLLSVLAQDTAFDRKEYDTLHLRAKEGLKDRKGYVVMFGLAPEPLFSTRFPYGTQLPPPVDDGSAQLVMETGKPRISNLFFGRTAQRRIFTAIVPIIRNDRVVGRLSMALEPQDIIDTVKPIGANPQWDFSIADRNFIYILSSDQRTHQTGQPVQASIVDQISTEAGNFRAEGEGGEPLLTGYRRSSLVGWTAFATVPVSVVEAPLSELWRKFTYAGLAAFTISLLAAYALSRVVARPIQQLTGLATAFGEGRELPLLHSTLREANLLSCAFCDAALQLQGRSTALAESERRFRLFAGQTPDVIWFVDLDKQSIDYISPGFEAITGRSNHEIATLENWRAAVYPEDLSEFERRFAGGLQDDVHCEYRILRPDGGVRWVHDMRFPLEPADGKPRVVAGILRDITAMRETVEALKAAQAEAEARAEELENLYSSAPIGLALMDRNLRLLRVNTFLATRNARAAETYTGVPFFEAFPELEQGARQHCTAVLKTGIPVKNVELEVRRQELSGPSFVLAHFYPVQVKNGAVSGLGVILEDITERKRTEQSLSRLAAIVYAANDAMFSVAPTGRIQNWNPAAQELFQFSEAEAAERRFSALFPEGRDDDYQELLRASEAGESQRLNTELLRKDGTAFPASVSIAPIKEAGRTTAISITIEDITDRENSEKRQLLMNRELSHRVKNTLAVIQAMARHTLRSSPDVASFTTAFEGRLRALAISHNLLTSSEWKGADIGELIREQLGPHVSSSGQLRLNGQRLLVPPGMATSLGLVLHELGTNAAKFGALSTSAGIVTLKWRVTPSVPHKTLTVEWTESGGPSVTPPSRKGFGSVLIENSGKVTQHFEPEGLRCTIEMPLMEQVSGF